MTQYEEFINQVKELVSKQPIPPHYNLDEWTGKSFNCYAYAMRICMDLFAYDINPGFISRGKSNDYRCTEEYTLKYFKEDCKALGLQLLPTDLEEEINENEYKIAVYVKPGMDFHFARQDSNGEWSEKNGWRKPIEVLKTDDVTKNENGYEFIGMFKVSKKE